ERPREYRRDSADFLSASRWFAGEPVGLRAIVDEGEQHLALRRHDVHASVTRSMTHADPARTSITVSCHSWQSSVSGQKSRRSVNNPPGPMSDCEKLPSGVPRRVGMDVDV